MGRKIQNRPPSDKGSMAKLHTATVVRDKVQTGGMYSHTERVREWPGFDGLLSNQQPGCGAKKPNVAQIHATSLLWHGAAQPTSDNHSGTYQLPPPTLWNQHGAGDYTDSGHCSCTSEDWCNRVSTPVQLKKYKNLATDTWTKELWEKINDYRINISLNYPKLEQPRGSQDKCIM